MIVGAVGIRKETLGLGDSVIRCTDQFAMCTALSEITLVYYCVISRDSTVHFIDVFSVRM